MKRIGITGQSGFLGTHLYNTLGLYPEEFKRIEFQDDYFEDINKLSEFVSQCDVIVHLAAMNRHNEPEVIYETNIKLVQTLIQALDKAGTSPHILISSSIQEERDNLYGKSKKEGRELLAGWAEDNDAGFTGFLFPNIFGPFGQPLYNSFIATFCHLLNKDETPEVEVDNFVPLIYVGEAVERIIDAIRNKKYDNKIIIDHQAERKVTEVLALLENFKEQYTEKGIIPALAGCFEKDLFNTFRSYIDPEKLFPVKLTLNTDERGSFIETLRTNTGGQFSFSTTKPGVTRGNHFHTRKIERFTVIKGKARIQLRKIGTQEVHEFELEGKQPAHVDMPVWYTHNITNTGTEDLYTLFWINEFFDHTNNDTYYEEV